MDKINDLYKNRGYLDSYGSDVVWTILFILITIGITGYSTYQSLLGQIRNNWATNRCNPIYMPFAGVIMPQAGVSAMTTTHENFSYCIKQDTSMIFMIAMMPFEFGIFLIIEFIDTVMTAIMAFMQVIQWLKDQIGGLFASIYTKILSMIVPLIEIVIHLRDALAKINGIAITTLFTTMNIYNTTVSGLLNVMTILTDMLVAVIAIIIAMVILSFILMPTPLFPVGISLYVGAVALLASFVIPMLASYTLMNKFTNEIMHESGPDSPSEPNIKKRDKHKDNKHKNDKKNDKHDNNKKNDNHDNDKKDKKKK